jgi:hypothetical protein
MNVGRKEAKSSSSDRMSLEWPIRAVASTQSTWMNRAKTWASGRKSSVAAPSALTTDASDSQVFSARSLKLPWVSWQPLGRPVVPDV